MLVLVGVAGAGHARRPLVSLLGDEDDTGMSPDPS
jgi:hypothetical protein